MRYQSDEMTYQGAARDHVNVFLYDGGIVPDPEGIITGGQPSKTAHRCLP